MAICGPTVYSRLASREVKSRTHAQSLLRHPAVQPGGVQWMMFENFLNQSLCKLLIKAIFIPFWRPAESFPFIYYYIENLRNQCTVVIAEHNNLSMILQLSVSNFSGIFWFTLSKIKQSDRFLLSISSTFLYYLRLAGLHCFFTVAV